MTTDSLPPPDPKLIAELFDRDPLTLTDADLDEIIRALRLDRANYMAIASAPKPSKSKAAAIPVDPKTLDDLLEGL